MVRQGFKVCIPCLAHPDPACLFCEGTGTYAVDEAEADLVVQATVDGVTTTVITTMGQQFRDWLNEVKRS